MLIRNPTSFVVPTARRASLVCALVSSAVLPSCIFWDMESWSDARSTNLADAALDSSATDASSGEASASEKDAGGSKYAAAVLLDNPIGYWRLDETSGTVAKDISGGGHDGRYAAGVGLGGTGAIAGDGAAISITTAPGTEGAVTMGTDSRFAFTGTVSFSIELWVKTSTNDDAYRGVLRRSRTGPREGYSIWLHTGKVGFERTANDENVALELAIPTDTFVYVVATYDVDWARLYINGELGKSTPMKTPIIDTGEPLTIGSGSKAAEFFPGSIDEIALYDKTLTKDQIKAHFDAAK